MQPVNLRDDHGLRRRARGIASRQPVRDLFEVLKPHSDVEPVENRRFRDASASENAPESGTTIGERRQHGAPGSANGIEVPPDQPFNVCPGFRDGAKNLTASRPCFDIAHPHLPDDVLHPHNSG